MGLNYELPPFDVFMREYIGEEKDPEQKYRQVMLSKKRYITNKGGRGSKKSCDTALKIIYFMMYYYFMYKVKPHVLVIRRYYNTHRNSTRAQLIWAIEKLGARELWNIPKGENTLTFKYSGQQILFRGMDDPQSITSITVSDGNLCWVWIEEAFQIVNEEDFNKIDMSIRGKLPPELFHQFILTFNPWSDRHWLKARFFDAPDENTLAITTNYMMNEFLSESDIRLYEIMKERYPRRYRIEGLGEWGIAEGLIFENWHEEDFDIDEIVRKYDGKKNERGLPALVHCVGMDFGFVDETAVVASYVDTKDYKIYVYYEYFKSRVTNREIATQLINDGYSKSLIYGDSADARSIQELRILGLAGLKPVPKGAGSVLNGIKKLQGFEIIISPRCPHTIESISNYAWEKDKLDNEIEKPSHEFSHLMDAMRYSVVDVGVKFGIQV